MSFVNQILNDDNYTTSTLKTMVEKEIERVISNKLLSKAECVELLNKYNDFNKENLSQIYNKLSNVKLAGDKLNENLISFKETLLNKLKETTSEIKSESCNCSNSCVKCSEPRVNKLESVYDMISNELEKIAYGLGKNGDHETAYLVERTLNKIKADLL